MADSDLAVAAAYADGLAFRPTARGARHGSGPPQQQQYHAYSNQSEDGGELPTVDDLEIAAAAAASALEDAAEDMSRTAGSMDSSEAESDSEAEVSACAVQRPSAAFRRKEVLKRWSVWSSSMTHAGLTRYATGEFRAGGYHQLRHHTGDR